jgi:hypothetical protein
LTILDTQPGWNGTSIAVLPFGEPNTATLGQTFTVGADNILQEFNFWHGFKSLGGPPLSLDFAGYVMAWDGAKATGTILYGSSMQTITGTGTQRFTFDTGNLPLVSGEEYVAFLSASNFFDGSAAQTEIGGMPQSDTYAGGKYVFQNNGSDTSFWTTQSWGSLGGNDVAFVANFVVPEPASLVMLGLGLAAVGAQRRR